ncbi:MULTISPECIES: ATP-binding cassette domain-containing protein [Bacillaceae]|uniref:ABC transporter ATP-binding protein n=1 Tax=Sutcliffiella horikoshii TaxID=79883 RepID=A0A5D4TCG3_9BACI|nr:MULTISPECIES: ABC transporter ATP-binding protein [Bacillaceae]TYS72965.1 ABC transporter ATP-binding protein [Sutcliffiella horikoshii]
MKVVECEGLVKKYGQSKALNDLSFQISENKITGLIGRNGAGKTTLLKIMAGFLKQTSGGIKIFNEQPYNSLFASANSILVDDQMAFPTSLNLGEVLDAAGRFYANWDDGLAKKLFDYFSFQNNQRHSELSKGMKSTFNMIVGLASKCSLTMFDEPTTGMDASVRKDFYRALLKDYIANPRTIIISSHHLEEMEDLLEDILLLNDGQKILHLPVSDLKEYAIGVKGNPKGLIEWLDDKEVLYKKEIGTSMIYAVIENIYSEKIKQDANKFGFELSPVSSNDICIYLTGKEKGGIDDVFK